MQQNIFQCSLDKRFRDIECAKKDLSMKYAACFILSPDLGKLYILGNFIASIQCVFF